MGRRLAQPPASAKMVSYFSLETNGSRLDLRAFPGGRHTETPNTPLVSRQRLSSTQDGVAAPHLLLGNPLAWVICLHLRSLCLLRATQILGR
jgi:hypothetical protein